MLRVCVRGFSEGKSEASKQATNFGLAKTSNFFYTLLATGFYFILTEPVQTSPSSIPINQTFNFSVRSSVSSFKK